MRYVNVIVSLFCAWVLWAGGPAIPTHRAEKAFENQAACEKALPVLSKEIQNRDGVPRRFICLPDTVDPREPKATR